MVVEVGPESSRAAPVGLASLCGAIKQVVVVVVDASHRNNGAFRFPRPLTAISQHPTFTCAPAMAALGSTMQLLRARRPRRSRRLHNFKPTSDSASRKRI